MTPWMRIAGRLLRESFRLVEGLKFGNSWHEIYMDAMTNLNGSRRENQSATRKGGS